MINQKIEVLFQTIKESKEYKDYQEIGKVLEKDSNIKEMINEIKHLQQQSVNLEYQNNPQYKEIDKLITQKVHILNQTPLYKEYLNRMNKLNDILSESTSNIEKYINTKI